MLRRRSRFEQGYCGGLEVLDVDEGLVEPNSVRLVVADAALGDNLSLFNGELGDAVKLCSRHSTSDRRRERRARQRRTR